MLCRVIENLLLSNLYREVQIERTEKSAQVVVPKKPMKVGGGKGLTVGIRQTLFI